MNELAPRWEIENAAWDAALSSVSRKGELIEDYEAVFKKFIKRKSCREAPRDYCAETLKAAINVAQYAVMFMRTKIGALPPKPVRRYQILLELAQELEIKYPEAGESLHMAGCRHVELHWDR